MKNEVFSFNSSVTTFSTKTLAKDLTMCEDWILSIDLELLNHSTTEWRNIFSLGVDKNNVKLDKRLLAVSIRSGQSNVMLRIANDMITNQSYEYKVTRRVNAGNWINIKISQMSGLYEIKVDYELVYSKTYFAQNVWSNVKLVTGKTYVNEKVLKVVNYRNFRMNTCKTKSKKLRR